MGRFNIIERRVARFVQEPPTVRGATAVIVSATFIVVIGAGVLMTVIDGTEFPNIGVGLWWAVQTVTTVGYGDVAPKDPGGRLVATVVMLEGTAFIAIVTAVTAIVVMAMVAIPAIVMTVVRLRAIVAGVVRRRHVNHATRFGVTVVLAVTPAVLLDIDRAAVAAVIRMAGDIKHVAKIDRDADAGLGLGCGSHCSGGEHCSQGNGEQMGSAHRVAPRVGHGARLAFRR